MTNIMGNELGIYVNADGTDISTWDAADLDTNIETTVVSNFQTGNWELVACSTSCSLNFSNSTIENVCKTSVSGALSNSATRTTIAGQQSWNMSVDGVVDLAAGATGESSYADLMTLALAKTEVLITFSTGIEGNAEYVGKAYISSIDATAGVDDFATYSLSLEGTGKLYKRDTDDGQV